MDMWRVFGPFLMVLVLFSACGVDDVPGISVFSVHSDLNKSQDEWEADFTGYPISWEDSVAYELKWDYTDLPPNVGGKGIMLSGNNIDGNLFMFIKNKVTGLSPNTDYSLVFDVHAVSNAQTTTDANGSPGNDVFLKAGASTTEPKKIIEGDNCLLSLDKGSAPNVPGSDLIVLGNIAVNPSGYSYIQRSNATYNAPFVARTNSEGELWVIIGTDSAYTGTTTIYYSRVDIIFTVPN
jgi:hypothetical protein